jgi:hypothetical protein
VFKTHDAMQQPRLMRSELVPVVGALHATPPAIDGRTTTPRIMSDSMS